MIDKVILNLDFNQGAIWISNQETGEPMIGIAVIGRNKEIAIINKKISDLYFSYYLSLIYMVSLIYAKWYIKRFSLKPTQILMWNNKHNYK